MGDMTILTTNMYNQATDGELSIKDAVALLKEQAVFRTLKDKLIRFEKGRDIRKLIVDGLMENDHGLSKEAIQRKVRGWFNNEERNIKKKDAMELCFVLDLSLEEADMFLTLVSEEGIHWRDPEELVYAFALKNKMTYIAAKTLYEEISAELEDIEESESFRTVNVKEKVITLTSIEDLKAYIKQMKTMLGRYHNTAYSFFMRYMGILENPPSMRERIYSETDSISKTEMPDDKRMPAYEIAERYLNSSIIPKFEKKSGTTVSSLSLVERNLRLNWPDEVIISKIKNREIDVSRKILILLFLATDGGEYMIDEGYIEEAEDMEEDDFKEEDVFADTQRRLAVMLEDCGFAPLDPRVPFDWMILYCMCVSESWEIDEKMKDFLKETFGNGNQVQE